MTDFSARISAFDEWLRESGHTDVADLIRDLVDEIERTSALAQYAALIIETRRGRLNGQ